MFDQEPDFNLLSRVSETFVKERDKAIEARKQSKLDDTWQRVRDQYQGLDEVNRPASVGSKSRTLDGPISTTMGTTGREQRSTVFVNITRPYTNAGTARVADILLPTGGKRNWDLKPTPVSDIALLASVFSENPEIGPAIPEQLMARLAQSPEEREAAINEAREIINDWLTESKWHSETRNQITEAGLVGTGVLKGPYARKRKVNPEVEALFTTIPLMMEDQDAARLIVEQLKNRLTFQPAVECIPVENCYPDMPSCGTDIQNGRFFWEEIPNVSKLSLQEMLGDTTYFTGQLQRCLDEPPLPCTAKGESADKKKKSYSRWRRTGEIDLAKLMPLEEGEKSVSNLVWAELEIINDRIVKVSLPALDTKEFPYRMLLWEKRQDSWAGIGIPEQIETPQRGLNASVRAGNDNMGWSVGFQLILGKGLEALDGDSFNIHAYKIWRDTTDSLMALVGDKARNPKDALGTIEFPNHLEKILPWINFWLQMAESTTGLTLLMQGQKATDSVGVSQMLMNSSTTNLRMFIKHWDDDVCAPIVQRMYEWVQLYGPESAKSDAVAAPLGSSALITRELQQQALVQLLDRTVQPVYGKSPKKTMDMFLEGMQFDPEQLDLDEEERARLEQAANAPDPKVLVEQMRAETDRYIAELKDARAEWEGLLDAQLKGASLNQALAAVETQVEGSIVQEGMRQEGKKDEKMVDAALNPESPVPMKVAQPQALAEPTVDEALTMLGMGAPNESI